jgi:serine/threonine protein kinase/tetratricopeptide (TPR) repeat protein
MECLGKTRIEEFVRGELPSDKVPDLEEHLDGCLSCLEIALQMAHLAQSSGTLPPPSERAEASSGGLVRALARYVTAAAPSADLPPATAIGPYQVLATLGRGAMGVVYRALHPESGKVVAIKTLALPDATAVAALRQEIAFLRRQRHPGIVSVLDDGMLDSSPWFAMEFLQGLTLQQYCRALRAGTDPRAEPGSRPLGAREASAPQAGALQPAALQAIVELYIELCSPLSFLHRAGIVHCDLAPNNVIVRADGQPVLIDFGLVSRATGAIGRESLEVGGLFRGTLPYIAPELIRGRLPDARADLYALGCNLFESLTGRPPFLETTVSAYARAHLEQPAPVASSLAPAVPRALDELLQALLEKRPADRLGDAEVVADLLARILAKPGRARGRQTWTPYLFRPRMIGRRPIVERIERQRESVARGHGALILLSGESGIGKTFLASELARASANEGFRVVTGECSAVAPMPERQRHVSVRALQPFAGLIQKALDQQREQASAQAAPSGLPRAFQILSRYLPGRDDESGAREEPLASLPPEAERERVLHAVREMLELMMTGSPLLLVLDDLQWADELSLTVLSDLAQRFVRERPLLILGFSRSEEASAELLQLRGVSGVESIEIGRLGSSSIGKLTSELLSGPAAEGLVLAVDAASEGNPFFVAECLREAAARGLLSYGAKGWALEATASEKQGSSTLPAALPLPRSSFELIERRLHLLDAATQRAVEAAAVLGRSFSVADLAIANASPISQCELWVDDMVRGQLVTRLGDGSARFTHDKLREAAYARIETRRRGLLHARAAHALESKYGGTPEYAARRGELAHHYEQCKDFAKAIDCLEAAGEHALDRSAGAEAARYFRAALAFDARSQQLVSVARRAYWHRRIGDALQSIGDLSGSKSALLDAVALQGYPVPKATGRLALAIIRGVATQAIHRAAPARWFAADPSQAAELTETARAFDRLMQTYYYRGEYGPMLLANLSMLNLVERGPISPSLAVGYTNAAAVAGIIPLRKLAARYFELAEGVLERAYHPEVESHLRLLVAHYEHGLGNWDKATASVDRALALTRELGYLRRWEDGAGVRSNLAFGRDFEESLAWSDKMYRSALRRGDAQGICWGLLRRAEVRAARGQLAELESELPELEASAAGQGRPEQLRALALRAWWLVSTQRFREAMLHVRRAERVIGESKGMHVYCIEAYAQLALVRLLAWARGFDTRSGPAAACRTLGAAAKLFPIATGRHRLSLGIWQWRMGDRAGALASWQRGLAATSSLGQPYDGALLTLALHAHSSQHVDPAARQNALGHLARLGVRGDGWVEAQLRTA